MESPALVTLGSTKYYHIYSGFAADLATTFLPWRVLECLAIWIGIVFTIADDMVVLADEGENFFCFGIAARISLQCRHALTFESDCILLDDAPRLDVPL